MCECFQIGGPWISEDPDCPVHGIEAQARRESVRSDLSQLLEQVAQSEDIDELRELAQQIAAVVEE